MRITNAHRRQVLAALDEARKALKDATNIVFDNGAHPNRVADYVRDIQRYVSFALQGLEAEAAERREADFAEAADLAATLAQAEALQARQEA